jgi:hypothetical protein
VCKHSARTLTRSACVCARYRYSNGDLYSGEWIGARRNGMGTLTMTNGETFERLWDDDAPVVSITPQVRAAEGGACAGRR